MLEHVYFTWLKYRKVAYMCMYFKSYCLATALCPEECGVNAECDEDYDEMYNVYRYECECLDGYDGDPTSYCGGQFSGSCVQQKFHLCA